MKTATTKEVYHINGEAFAVEGATAEERMMMIKARAALRAHCRAQEAVRKAERDKRAEHLRVNSGRLGWVVGHPPARPKKFPVRVGQRPEIRFNGRRALVARWQDAFIGFDSGHPVKRLTFEIVVGRYDCFRIVAMLEDDDLTPETYWLSGCDVSEVTGGAIRFCSGFELAARDCAAAFAVQAIPEPEVAASRHLLKAAAALQQAEHKPLTAAQPKARATTQQSGFSKQAHDFIEWAWPEFVLMRKGTKLRVSRHRFIIHDKYREECQKHGIKNIGDVRRIQDALRKHKPVEKK